MKQKYNGLCVIDSVYTLFLFILVNIKDYKNFFYIFWVNMPKSISDKFQYKLLLHDSFVAISNPHNYIQNWHYKFRFYYLMTKYRLWTLPVCGQDHLPFSRFILNYTYKNFEEYEDGLANYVHQEEVVTNKLLKRLCAADAEPRLGYSDKVKKIYLTDSNITISPVIADKVQYVDIKKIWDNLCEEKKEEVKEIFMMSKINIDDDIETIVLTRPFSEAKIFTEEKKIRILKDILNNSKISKVAIKPHYRERTNYKKLFPDINILEGKFPIELFMLMYGGKIKKFITYGECSAEHFIRRYYPETEYLKVAIK